MARQYVDEIGDGTVVPGATDGQATSNSAHVKTIAPIYYTPATVNGSGVPTRQTPVTIKSALDAKQDTLTEMTETEVDNLLAVLT